ncbi:MAG: 2'-5' RNA ligase family protein [Flavobacteriales bacterium]|nr:2'-5' RNA ligase family protein [Flavobacteriales bacterium]
MAQQPFLTFVVRFAMRPTHRYLAIIAPSDAIAAAVVRMRGELHAHIGDFSGRLLIPHITLFFADVPDEMGMPIAAGIEAGIRGARPFLLTYADITHFPDRRTIHIDLVEKERIGTLRGVLVEEVRQLSAFGDALRVTDHPHLTIAAGLKPGQFDAAWALLAPYAFHAEHTVSEVCLMRRELKPGAVYGMMRRFPFG